MRMNNETVIISMTSYPKRIKTTRQVYDVIMNQKQKGDNVHFVLVLSEDEFPNKELDLPKNLQRGFKGEIIWDKGNIKSHKKLIPTLEKYPKNPILVIDDDMTMKPGWLHEFLDMHKKYPEDIIYGQTSSTVIVDNDGSIREIRSFENTYMAGVRTINQKPANGASGTLYPAKTFTSPIFFDRKVFMELSPTSDETWQYMFCVLGNKKYRSLQDNGICYYDIQTNQENCLAEVNKEKYTEIHNKLAEHFPQYKEKLKQRFPGIVASMTTYGERVKTCLPAIKSIVEQTLKPEKIIINIPIPDLINVPKELQELAQKNIVDIIPILDDWGVHDKWINASKLYFDKCIFLFDDDVIYDSTLIQRMYLWWQINPGCVISTRCRIIAIDDTGNVAPYSTWPLYNQEQGVAYRNFLPTNVGGVMIPPYVLENAIDYDKIKEALFDDDIYLKYVYNKHLVNILYIDADNQDIAVNGVQLSADMEGKIERIKQFTDNNNIYFNSLT